MADLLLMYIQPCFPKFPTDGPILLDQHDGFSVQVGNIRKAFETMLDEIGLPRDCEIGMKLIRRLTAQIARKRIGEEHWW